MTCIGKNLPPVFNTQKGEEGNEYYFELNRRGAVPPYYVEV
jgi:hypothetical protein